MQWKQPPRIKIYEALGAIGDSRIKMLNNTAKVFSSTGKKYYDVVFDPKTNVMSANDNGSFWQGYVGYPAIAFLLMKNMIAYNKKLTTYLKGFAWKEINTTFKNDFDKTERYVRGEMVKRFSINLKEFDDAIERIETQLQKLQLEMPQKRVRPPKE